MNSMSFMSQLERRFRRYAIPNLTGTIVICQVTCYILQSFGNPEFVDLLLLKPRAILQGEVWRLFTFVCVPPRINFFFAFFYFYLFYMMGTALEHQWGAFRYNLFLLIAYVANVGVALGTAFFAPADSTLESYFIYGTIFLAFAYLFPEFEFLIFLILPIKVKWLALFTWIGYGLSFFNGLANFSAGGWVLSLSVLASVSNFICFFGRDIYRRLYYAQRKASWNSRVTNRKREPRHQCAVCGVTDLIDPRMDFRYCTKCEGTPGYCSQHIHNHVHKMPRQADSAVDHPQA